MAFWADPAKTRTQYYAHELALALTDAQLLWPDSPLLAYLAQRFDLDATPISTTPVTSGLRYTITTTEQFIHSPGYSAEEPEDPEEAGA